MRQHFNRKALYEYGTPAAVLGAKRKKQQSLMVVRPSKVMQKVLEGNINKRDIPPSEIEKNHKMLSLAKSMKNSVPGYRSPSNAGSINF